jgi:hypothetical protein
MDNMEKRFMSPNKAGGGFNVMLKEVAGKL